MLKRTLQATPYTRNMAQVLRFSVTLVEPGEDAEDFGSALRRHRCVELRKYGGVEKPVVVLPRAHVAAEQRHLQRLRYIHARILEQRGDVVGGRTHNGVLKINDADSGNITAPRKPKQIGRMVIAQDPGCGRLDRGGQRVAPQRKENLAPA